jgi:hypothetical protein
VLTRWDREGTVHPGEFAHSELLTQTRELLDCRDASSSPNQLFSNVSSLNVSIYDCRVISGEGRIPPSAHGSETLSGILDVRT